MTELFNLGYRRMMDAIRTGEVLIDVFLGLTKSKNTESATDLAGGALSCIVDCYAAMRDVGMTVTCTDAAMQAFMNGSKGRIQCELVQNNAPLDSALLLQQITCLCSAVAQISKQILFKEVEPPVAKVEPIPVRLVSSPDRVTTTTVVRDPVTLEIISTVQLQTDVVN